MNLQQLAKINATTLRSAGPRYAPGIDAAAPNLQIESLILAIEGLLCGDRFQKRIVDLHGSLKEAWKAAQGHIQKPHRRKIQRADRLLNLFVKLKECPIGKGCSVVTRARAAAHKISLSLGNLDKAFYEEERKRRDALREEQKDSYSDPKLRSIEEQEYYLRRCEGGLSLVTEFLDSPGCHFQFTNSALLLGPWGTGKTHFLCDLAQQHVKNGAPSFVVLAKDFDPEPDIGTALAKFTGLASNLERLLKDLNAMGRVSRQRALVMSDGINEADHDAWRRGIAALTKAGEFPEFPGTVYFNSLSYRCAGCPAWAANSYRLLALADQENQQLLKAVP